MKFHTTLGIRQTHYVIFISANTTVVLNMYCEMLISNDIFFHLKGKLQRFW